MQKPSSNTSSDDLDLAFFCEECDRGFDEDRCPTCPSDAELLEQDEPDFYSLAHRVFREHEEGGYATKMYAVSEMMKIVFAAGVERGKKQT